MSFWNNPENNAVKAVIVVALVVVAGYFVYNAFHKNSLQNTGSVVAINAVSTVGAFPSSCGTGTPTLSVAPDPTFTASTVHAGDLNDAVARFILTNPSTCTLRINQLTYSLAGPGATPALLVGPHSVLQNIRAYDGTAAFGLPILHPTDNAIHSIVFTAATPMGMIVIRPGASATVTLDSAIDSTAVSGSTFQLQAYTIRGAVYATGSTMTVGSLTWSYPSVPTVPSNLFTVL